MANWAVELKSFGLVTLGFIGFSLAHIHCAALSALRVHIVPSCFLSTATRRKELSLETAA